MATRYGTSSEHTFLVADGEWEARGRGLVGPDARDAEITGRTSIKSRGGGLITAESLMTVHADIPFDVRQMYEVRRTILPERLTFISRNDRIGELEGEIWLLPDYVVLHYASPKGRFRGSEMLIRRSPDHYTAVGHFVADRRAQTVWEVELTRTAVRSGLDF
jgi:hypothetical protein